MQHYATTAISLPLKDVQVLPDIGDSYIRGIPIKFGDPAQHTVILPWAELNNAWLYDYDALCDTSMIFDDTICRVRRGNFFLENEWTSCEKVSSIVIAGAATIETASHSAESGIAVLMTTSGAGLDIFSPGSTNLVKFPIEIPREAWDHG
ncbi:uncharacterized protein Bfra_007689 [Botrytis fragariae]|uniref:Uncharacterized protein n=1 Tax=Botrytis fragariae TaxID=1964551 RepID=A0A8H6APV5_9HELO|nr:uncharacterized protein Bfra_007689 [Botrytis fragariae]KAF5871175.1 hypothetical protein Bfra_007689 [Botrytis fragariae]